LGRTSRGQLMAARERAHPRGHTFTFVRAARNARSAPRRHRRVKSDRKRREQKRAKGAPAPREGLRRPRRRKRKRKRKRRRPIARVFPFSSGFCPLGGEAGVLGLRRFRVAGRARPHEGPAGRVGSHASSARRGTGSVGDGQRNTGGGEGMHFTALKEKDVDHV